MEPLLPLTFQFLIGALLGLIVGSFLNVVIVRVPEDRSVVHGGSACPVCGQAIRWYDNIPLVSWAMLAGRCRSCKTQISLLYPAVELAGAGVVLLSLWVFGSGWDAAISAVLLLGLIPLAVIDARTKRLPNPIVGTLAVIGVVLVLLAAGFTGEWRRVIEALIAAAVCLAFFALLTWGSERLTGRAGMGWGDVKLAGVLGLYLGWLAPRFVVICFLLAFMSGALVGVGLIVTGKGSRKTALPFGVYLALGALLSVLVADSLADWYLRVGVA